MIKSIIKAVLLAAALLAAGTAMCQTDRRAKADKPAKQTIKLGGEIRHRGDTLQQKRRRGLQQHLIIPKGEWQVGAQISHVSFSSNNSEYLLIVQNLDANGSITKVAPYVAYSYHDNRSIGVKLQYSAANGNINKRPRLSERRPELQRRGCPRQHELVPDGNLPPLLHRTR